MEDSEIGPFIVEDRRMLSRVAGDRIRITHILQPGSRRLGCLTCCHAPDKCPCLSYLPCFDYPAYIVNEINSSKYIYIRENSLEWNNPHFQNNHTKGCCTCELVVKDDVTVLHFDDVHFEDIRNSTRHCNDCKTFCFGGNGEQILIDSRFCWGMCRRTSCGRGSGNGGGALCGLCGCCCCGWFVPSFCPDWCCPCFGKTELWVEDAKTAVQTIKMVRDEARERLSL